MHHRWESRIEGGESCLDLRARFLPLVNGLLRDYANRLDNGDTRSSLVLIGHGALFYYHMLTQTLVNLPPKFEGASQHRLCAGGSARPEGLVLFGVVWRTNVSRQSVLIMNIEEAVICKIMQPNGCIILPK